MRLQFLPTNPFLFALPERAMNIVEMQHMTKRFGQYVANDDVSVQFQEKSIHAIIGENGAGKSTLMKMLYGFHTPDKGIIRIRGKEERISDPSRAISLGIGMVHQHFMLIPALTALENIILGDEPTRYGSVLDIRRAEEEVISLSEKYGLTLNPRHRIQNLPIGSQQRVEILKILYRKADIIIFDEPTPVLTPQEVHSFLTSLENLRAEGKTIILITHKLSEVFTVCDRLTILRQGKVVLSCEKTETTPHEVARLMTGQDLPPSPGKDTIRSEDKTVEFVNVSSRSRISPDSLKDMSFYLRRGEILGVAGVEGNGQASLIQLVLGFQHPISGRILWKGKSNIPSAIAYIPDDRIKNGMISDFTLQENLLLGRHKELEFSHRSVFQRTPVNAFSSRVLSEYDVQPGNPSLPIRNLSGGNQQKLVVGRELTKDSELVVANQPTRGLDIKAIEFVHSVLIRERNRGRSVLLISSDLAELLKLSDRIIVMYEGTITGVFDSSATTDEELGLYMTGVKRQVTS